MIVKVNVQKEFVFAYRIQFERFLAPTRIMSITIYKLSRV